MAINNKLDMYWSEFLNNFICTLLADGYDEFEILDKIMSVFKTVRETRYLPEKEISEPPTLLKDDAEINPNEDIVIVQKKHRKYPENKKNPDRSANPHNYDKTLSSKFSHAYVYVRDKKDESLATIEYGPSQKVKDVYKLVSTGDVLNEVQYLKKFNSDNEETPKGFGFLNRHVIVFEVNPDVSVGYVKMPCNYKKFNSIEDIKQFTKYAKRK